MTLTLPYAHMAISTIRHLRASSKQGPHPSGRAAPAHIEEEPIQWMDVPTGRTGHPKGFYLRLVLRATLPPLEEHHWNQVAAGFKEEIIDHWFPEIMTKALEDVNKES